MSDITSSDWSETDASNDASAPDGWPEGMLPSSVNDTGRGMMGAIKRTWNRDHATATVGGTGNAITLTYAAGPNSYVTGEQFAFKATAANTGATTLNVSSLGAKNLYKPGASGPTALVGGEIQVGQIVVAQYDGAQFVMTSPVAGAVQSTRSIVSGNGLTGGGDLSADRTLAVGQGTGIFVQADVVGIDKATQADMEGQTANKVVTADNFKQHPASPKAWGFVGISGTTATLAASFGVSSVTRNGVGDYTVTVSTAFSSTSAFAVGATLQQVDSSGANQNIKENASRSRTTTTFHLLIESADGSNTDPAGFNFWAFGDQ